MSSFNVWQLVSVGKSTENWICGVATTAKIIGALTVIHIVLGYTRTCPRGNTPPGGRSVSRTCYVLSTGIP